MEKPGVFFRRGSPAPAGGGKSQPTASAEARHTRAASFLNKACRRVKEDGTPLLWKGVRRAFLRHFAIEKDKTRGGDTAPSGPKRAEKLRFSAKRQAVWFEMQSISN